MSTELQTASDLFCLSQGAINWSTKAIEDARKKQSNAIDRCHWCGSPCERTHFHDDPPIMPFSKQPKSKAKCPSNAYICHGCYLWGRKRVTVNFLDGSFKDVQCAMNHSWIITKNDAKAINDESRLKLYPFLLKPDNSFVLCLLEKGTKEQNQLFLSILNDIAEIKGDTVLKFTLNNIPHTYTIYDLESALRNAEVGQSPGVRALINFCGPFTLPPLVEKEDRRGAPKTRGTGPLDTLRREIKMSGKNEATS